MVHSLAVHSCRVGLVDRVALAGTASVSSESVTPSSSSSAAVLRRSGGPTPPERRLGDLGAALSSSLVGPWRQRHGD